jgi:hypothetical protein
VEESLTLKGQVSFGAVNDDVSGVSLALLGYVLHSARLIGISFLSVLYSRSTVLLLSKKTLFLVLFASLSIHVLFWGPKECHLSLKYLGFFFQPISI